jgi:hypothetical protein
MSTIATLRNQGFYHDFFADSFGNLIEWWGATTSHENYGYIAKGVLKPNTDITYSRVVWDEQNGFYVVYWVSGLHPNGYDVTTAYWWGNHWQVVGSPAPTAAADKAHRRAVNALPDHIREKVVDLADYSVGRGTPDLKAKLEADTKRLGSVEAAIRAAA